MLHRLGYLGIVMNNAFQISATDPFINKELCCFCNDILKEIIVNLSIPKFSHSIHSPLQNVYNTFFLSVRSVPFFLLHCTNQPALLPHTFHSPTLPPSPLRRLTHHNRRVGKRESREREESQELVGLFQSTLPHHQAHIVAGRPFHTHWKKGAKKRNHVLLPNPLLHSLRALR